MKKLSHRDLIDLGQLLGYPSLENGLCQGITGMWAQAVLAKDEVSFVERLQLISTYKRDFIKLNQAIEQAKERVRAHHVLAVQEKKLLDILSFFDGIQLYLNPHEHTKLFAKIFVAQHHLPVIYPFAKSDQLVAQDLTILLDKPYAFNHEELSNFLTELAGLLQTTATEYPILLSNGRHSIGAKYNSLSNIWHYLDTNDFKRYEQYPKYIRELNLATLVASIFVSLEGSQNHVVFNLTILTNHQPELVQLRNKLLTLHSDYPSNPKVTLRRNQSGIGLWYLACRLGDLAMVQALLKQPGLALNQICNKGISPLYVACKHGHLAIVKTLLMHPELEINQFCNDDGTSPLYIACQHGHLEIVQALLTYPGLAVNQTQKDGVSPLYIACQQGHLAIVQTLLTYSGLAVNQTQKDGASPLYIACQQGHLAIVQTLLTYSGLAVNQACKDGASPLYIACQQGHLAIVKVLLTHLGLAVNQARKDGASPLYIACQHGHLAIVQDLLTHPELAVNQACKNGANPLYIACQQGYDAIVSVLLTQQKIMIDAIGIEGYTPLQVACFLVQNTQQNTTLFNLLLSKKASLTHHNEAGQRAMDIAIAQNNTAAIITLLTFIKAQQLAPLKVMSQMSLRYALAWSKEYNSEINHYLIYAIQKQILLKSSHRATFFAEDTLNQQENPDLPDNPPQSILHCLMM